LLRTAIYYLLFFPWTLICAMVAIPSSFINANLAHSVGIFWGRHCLTVAGLRLKVNGSENIPRDQPAIYVCNHQSNFDIPILYAGLPIQFRWMAKKELFDIPVFGLAMKRCGYIPIDRSDRRKAMHSLADAAERIKGGTSVIVFPEGTRSPDGRLQEFKKGALVIAAKAQVPVVPVAIDGSHRAQPRGSIRVNGADLRMTIFPPLATDDLKVHAIEDFTQKLHSQIASALEGGAGHAA